MQKLKEEVREISSLMDCLMLVVARGTSAEENFKHLSVMVGS